MEKLGKYSVVREIGRGGMGKVYEGQDPEGNRVAIKTMLLPEDLDPAARWDAIERFMREARAARALKHRNIVEVLDVGEEKGEYFIVMEYLEGQSVRDLIDLAGALKPERAVQIVGEVCGALAYAHEQGVVHRDIKPDNIMILKDGRVKLADFGLAAITSERSVTVTGTMMGTFAYMSPEQARGEKVAAASDIFSLGASMYEMVSGQKPFSGEATAAVLAKIINEDPPALRGVPPHISRAISKCLQKDAKLRYRSAGALLDALEPQQATMTAPRVPTPPPVAPPGTAPPGTRAPAAPPTRPTTPYPAPPPLREVEVFCQRCGAKVPPRAQICPKCRAPVSTPAAKQRDAGVKDEMRSALKDLEKQMAPRKRPWEFWKR